MANEILTIGYGNMSPDEFLTKTNDFGITNFVDVRREGSKAWCHDYATGEPIANLLQARPKAVGPSVPPNRYIHVPELGRPKEMSLDDYKIHLCGTLMWRPIVRLSGYIWGVVRSGGVPAIMCACGKAFEADNVTPRCHRVYVAQAVADYLGGRWVIRHEDSRRYNPATSLLSGM